MSFMIRNVRLAGAESGAVDVRFDETVTSIGPVDDSSEPGPGTEIIDGTGRFLAPGLIDTHVHLKTDDALQAAGQAGLTTLVDLGTYPDSLVQEFRSAPDLPDIISAGSAASAPGSTQIAMMGFPSESGVSDPGDAERFLNWRSENGSQLIKIIIEDPDFTAVPALSIETIRALVDGAQRRGLLTIAHVVTAAAFDRGLDGGVDILTHAPTDRPLAEATLQRMLDAGTIVSPTLVMMRTMAKARLGERADASFAVSLESVRQLHDAGVPIIAGTDANESPLAPVPHGRSLHEELDLLQEAGLSAAEALSAATDGAAAALRLSDRGRIDNGLRADLILLDGDPLADTAPLQNPAAVWTGGHRIG